MRIKSLVALGVVVASCSVLTAAIAADSFSGPDAPPPGSHDAPSLYERITAHYGPMGREVKEEFRDGPCHVERHWEPDGEFEEKIKCRPPRR